MDILPFKVDKTRIQLFFNSNRITKKTATGLGGKYRLTRVFTPVLVFDERVLWIPVLYDEC